MQDGLEDFPEHLWRISDAHKTEVWNICNTMEFCQSSNLNEKALQMDKDLLITSSPYRESECMKQ